MATAQLVVQRSGQLDWLRRAARQRWTITPDDGDGWAARADEQPVEEGRWLVAAPDGSVSVAAAPVLPSGEPVLSALRHPRSGRWFCACGEHLFEQLSEQGAGRRHPLAAAAMTLSADLHRLYAVTAQGELYVLAASAYRQVLGEPVSDEAELVLGGLAEHGAPSGLALGPAGLVLVTDRAVVGINLRSRSVAPILADLSAHPALAVLQSPAVAMDHRRNLYLADEDAAVYAPAFGAPPAVIARPSRAG